MSTHLEAIRKKVQSLKDEIEEANDRANAASEELKDVRQDLVSKELEITSLKRAADKAEDLENENSELKEKLKAHDDDANSAQQKIMSLEYQVKNLEDEVTRCEATIKKLQDELAANSAAHISSDGMQSKVADLEEDVSTARREKKEIDEQYQALLIVKEGLERKLVAQEEQEENHLSQIAKLKSESEKFQRELTEFSNLSL